jgi:hypothetical protein
MHDVVRPSERALDARATSWLLMLGRLKPGVTLEQARQQIPMLIKREVFASSSPAEAKAFAAATSKDYVSEGSKGFSRVRTEFRAPLLTLMIGVALLLCIICANVANLLLARAIARGCEMSVRLALGADRSRIVRQLLTESVVLAVLSAATGLLVAWWGSRTLLAIASGSSSIHLSLSRDVRVLAFTLAVSIGAVALFGLVPALRAARGDVATMLRSGSGHVEILSCWRPSPSDLCVIGGSSRVSLPFESATAIGASSRGALGLARLYCCIVSAKSSRPFCARAFECASY